MDVTRNSAYRMNFELKKIVGSRLSDFKNRRVAFGWRHFITEKDLIMVGLGHGAEHPAEQEDPRDMERNARNGMLLFVVYLAFYGGFVALNAFWPKKMEETPIWGINLAILYGGGLIISAMVLALLYSWLCRGTRNSSGNYTSRGQD